MDIQSITSYFQEPIRAYNFSVRLPNDFGDNDVVENRIISVEFNFPEIKLDWETKVAPGYSVPLISNIDSNEELTMEFIEAEDGKVHSYFKNWRDRIFNWNSMDTTFCEISLPREYKRDIIVDVLNSDDSIWNSYLFLGSFPTEIEGFQFSFKENDVLKIKVSFAWDYVEIL